MGEKTELLLALEQIEKDKKIKKEDILTVIENALVSAYKKHVGKNVNVEASVNPETGEMAANVVKIVAKDVENSLVEISLQDAKKISGSVEIGSEVRIPLDTQHFSRIAAQTAKQVIVQKIRESEKNFLFDEMKGKIGQIVSGVIYRALKKNLIVDLGKTEAIIPDSEQVLKEKFSVGQHIKAIVLKVDKNIKGSGVVLSRSSVKLVSRLFELEVPEIYEKIVEIVNIEREPGVRTKVAVISHNPKVDPVGACVGIKGARVKPIIDELRGEKIDLVSFSNDPVKYIAASLSPVKVVSVAIISADNKQAEVIVSDDMLSLAIGKNGQNVRLAAKLTGWHIDVKSESQKKQESQTKVENKIQTLEKLEGLSEKVIQVLVNAGFTDIEKLSSFTVKDLTTLPGIGQKTADKIIEAAKRAL
ncbi:MAG: transcription termination factor NusA [Endomicrobium sp.]|jgi:N utilization substance protein A|nr:transcription termination factor NusA [Endomicrobium sp.]